jgi:hypothetical protein
LEIHRDKRDKISRELLSQSVTTIREVSRANMFLTEGRVF